MLKQHPLTPADFSTDAPVVARNLIGATLLVDGVGGIIVETEAYDVDDPAAHCHGGLTQRNRAMFGTPGHAYVYRSYGLHWCLNLVCREAGHGAGVLIRALQPTHGLDIMRRRRGVDNERLLCAGPGRVGQALGITLAHYGLPLNQPPFSVLSPPDSASLHIISGIRIGISKAQETPWRFGLSGSPYLSRKF